MQRHLLEAFGIENPEWPQLLAGAGVLVALLLGALTLYLGRLYRSRRPRDRAARCFERFARKLGRTVRPRRPSEAPSAFGIRAAAALPTVAGDIERIVGTYLKARYEPDVDGRALASLEAAVRSFDVRRTPPRR
jgi:protein-glutamine gamma-glutamyltransferase